MPIPADREILHLLPQEFILDDQAGVHDPLGMMAARLEVRVHMVTAATSATQNVITAVNRAGVHVDDTVFEPLACRRFRAPHRRARTGRLPRRHRRGID